MKGNTAKTLKFSEREKGMEARSRVGPARSKVSGAAPSTKEKKAKKAQGPNRWRGAERRSELERHAADRFPRKDTNQSSA